MIAGAIFAVALMGMLAALAIRWISAPGDISRGTAATTVIVLMIAINWFIVFTAGLVPALLFGAIFWPTFIFVGMVSWIAR
jgi:hypothetical protein